MGSLRTLNPPAPKPSDRGQYFKVHLLCGQSISVSGSVTENTLYGGHLNVDLYDASQELVIGPPSWVAITAQPSATYQSTTFVNPNSVASDFYIRVSCDYLNIQDFTINIASNEVDNPRPIAPDATGGMTPNSEEFHIPASIDTDVLTGRATELYAKVYWPPDFSGGPYPLVAFLHGNHTTCGTGPPPRFDNDNTYTLTGACPSGYTGSGSFSLLNRTALLTDSVLIKNKLIKEPTQSSVSAISGISPLRIRRVRSISSVMTNCAFINPLPKIAVLL